ncbi:MULTISPECIES: hypothetical protein [Thalassobaculum]|uniref:Flagellar protein FliL n=1 Tax=Thalassobaculum litoreum DSM 18839 TaxID=1123362 RepID=A0A8G2EWN6_9PROT|nr:MULTISPECIES: hypothetical protein [Thalassobaculum]SDF88353.1 hypothetical protein SAMN05660686_02676 [Thalassobaculum litoreum DSM 18839]
MIRISLAAAVLALLVAGAPILSAPVLAETSSTKERKEEQKQRDKEHKQFNREIQYRRVVGPNVLPIGPFSISVFVKGQPLEARLRVAIEAKDVQAKTALDAQKWAVNGIVYPLAVKLYEQGRPNRDQIELFKMEAQTQLSERYPDMVEAVYIESLI